MRRIWAGHWENGRRKSSKESVGEMEARKTEIAMGFAINVWRRMGK